MLTEQILVIEKMKLWGLSFDVDNLFKYIKFSKHKKLPLLSNLQKDLKLMDNNYCIITTTSKNLKRSKPMAPLYKKSMLTTVSYTRDGREDFRFSFINTKNEVWKTINIMSSPCKKDVKTILRLMYFFLYGRFDPLHSLPEEEAFALDKELEKL